MGLRKSKSKEDPQALREVQEQERQKQLVRRRLTLLQYELELLSRKYSD